LTRAIQPNRNSDSSAWAWVAVVGLTIAYCAALGYLIVRGGNTLILAIGVSIAPVLLAIFVVELRNAGTVGASSRVMVAAVASLPLLMLVYLQGDLIAVVVVLAVQAFLAVLVIVLFANLSAERRAKWLRSTPALRPLGALFGLTLVLSYVASGVSRPSQGAYLISLLLASAFFVMPVLIVRDLDQFEWLVAVLVVVGAIQVAVVAAQAAGLADALPGPLSVLSTARWGGPIGAGGPNRYPGTFGDVELMAEYASLVTVLCIGLTAVSRRKSLRALGVVCAAGAVVTGLLTGTRGYVLAVAIGLGVLILLLLSTPRSRGRVRAAPVVRVIAVAVLLVTAVYTLVPDAVLQTIVGRFAKMELTGSSAFNRQEMFVVWMRLAEQHPLLGYGDRMLDTIRASYPGPAVQSPHSLYFWVLLTAGIPGLVAFLLFIGALLFGQVRIFRTNGGPTRAWSAVFIAVLVAWLANEYKIDCVRSPLYVDWLMFVFGMPLALFAVSPERTEETAP
jgi:O-antigen ligase